MVKWTMGMTVFTLTVVKHNGWGMKQRTDMHSKVVFRRRGLNAIRVRRQARIWNIYGKLTLTATRKKERDNTAR